MAPLTRAGAARAALAAAEASTDPVSSVAVAYQQLYDASRDGRLSQVQFLIGMGAFPHATPSSKQRTALHAAAENGHADVVALLTEAGWSLDARTSKGLTPLHLAAFRGHTAAAQQLLALSATLGVDVRGDSGGTPLHAACTPGHTPIIEMLLDAGASVDVPDGDDVTPIHLAAWHGRDAAVALLLASGAGVEHKTVEGRTALHCACQDCHLPVVRRLLAAGADVHAEQTDGSTPLLLASLYGSELVVRKLLAAGADPVRQDKEGWSPLMVAAHGGHLGVLQCLMRLSPVLASLNAATNDGHTALMAACCHAHEDVAVVLVAAGADMHAKDSDGYTPLHFAAHGKHAEVVAALLAHGADPGTAIPSGQTLLHLAAEVGDLPLLSQLLAAMAAGRGSSSLEVMYKGMTALHWALEKGHSSCVEALLAAGADANTLYGEEAEDEEYLLEGATALHRAVEQDDLEIVQLLAPRSNLHLKYGDDTALHLALACGSADMARVLVAAGVPTLVADADGDTAMGLVACSSCPEYRALLPAMVLRECEWCVKVQQQGGQKQEGLQQQDPAAVLVAVADAVYNQLQATADEGPSGCIEQGAACFKAVMDVLGVDAASSLLQQVLHACQACQESSDGEPDGNACLAQLVQVLNSGWVAALEPLLKQRRRVSNRLQGLVIQPLHQHQKQRAPGCQPDVRQSNTSTAQEQHHVTGNKQWAYTACLSLWQQAVAATEVGTLEQFVQHLEQLSGLDPAWATSLLYEVAGQHHKRWPDGVTQLCGVLLGSWAAARQQAATRAVQEVTYAVVMAVQAWKPGPGVSAGGSQRRG